MSKFELSGNKSDKIRLSRSLEKATSNTTKKLLFSGWETDYAEEDAKIYCLSLCSISLLSNCAFEDTEESTA